MRAVLLLGVVVALGGAAARAQGNPHTYWLNLDPAVQAGFQRFNNADFEGALTAFQQIEQQHAGDPVAADYVLMALMFRELYQQDLLDTTMYAHEGFLTSKRVGVEAPGVRRQIEDKFQQAVRESDARLKANGSDKDALFARGYAKALHAVYLGMMDHAFVGGLHEALGATKDHEKVLQMDPQYADAEMVVGVEKFCAATLPAWLKPVGRLLGLSGTKADGLRMLHEAAERGTITVVQSQIASTIFLRHDARYTEALAEQQRMAAEYPHNFLIRLEEANLSKDRGDGWKAIAIYRAVIADAGRKGYFVEPRTQLAWFGLGEGLRGQNQFKDAADAYAMATKQPTCAAWLKKRAEQNAAEMAQRAQAAPSH